jgi:Xaa-Pro aminopeptidase
MMNNRLVKLRQALADNNTDAMLISQADNRCYLSGFYGSAGYLLIAPKKAWLATDFRYIEQASRQASGYEIIQIKSRFSEWLPELIAGLGIKKLGFEAEDITVATHRQLEEALKGNIPAIELVPLTGMTESLRMVKEPGEIECIARAAAIGDTAYTHIEKTVAAGMTENQVAWEIEKSLRVNGSQTVPFEIIVASGPNAALPHHRPGDRVIRPGEPVLIDMGARYRGYASDLSRTICTGNPDDTFLKIYRTVLDAQEAAMAIIKSGMTGQQADSTARTVIEKAGYGDHFGHSLGHGVGLAAHELPHLSTSAEDILDDGMVFTVEPGIYLSGWGGIRIEDTVVMENGKARPISQARKVRYD